MLRWYTADLHVHTVLSACAELSMGPKDIVLAAIDHGLDLIAITDHNSIENVHAVLTAAKGTTLSVIPGMEVSTADKIHLVVLFPDLTAAAEFQNFVYSRLPVGHYDEELYGPQIVCDQHDHIVDTNHKMLILGIQASLDEVADQAVACGGLIYPAHIDRSAYSILNKYPSIPAELPFVAVELSAHGSPAQMIAQHPEVANYPMVFASDAHDISAIGSTVTHFLMRSPTFSEIKKAFYAEQGRRVSIEPVRSQKAFHDPVP